MIKISKKQFNIIILSIILCFYFEPLYFKNNPALHNVSQCVRIITVIVLIAQTLLCKSFKHHKLNKITTYTIFYCTIMFISTIVNHRFELNVLGTVTSIIGIAIFFELNDFSTCLRAMNHSFFILIFVNTFLHLFARNYVLVGTMAYNGSGNWFLEGGNALAIFVFPAICFSMISIECRRDIVLSWFLIILCIYTSLESKAATCIFIILFTVTSWILYRIFKLYSFGIKQIAIGIILIFLVVVVLQITDRFAFAEYIVRYFLKRDITFTGRTYVWAQSFREILNSPLIGHGVGYTFHVGNMGFGFWADHAHNHFLQQLLQGGIIQFVLFILIVKELIKKMNDIPKNMATASLIIFFMSGVLYVFESYTNAMIQSIVYLLFYYSESVINENKQWNMNTEMEKKGI